MEWLIVAGAIFALNLVPAFAPPTWAALVLIRLNTHLPFVFLVVVGAFAAASGRLVLATAARHLARRLSATRRAQIGVWRDWLVQHRQRAAAGLLLFVLSPLPSGQLFVAAGVMRIPLVPCASAFFVGRLVSYSVYVAGATAVDRSYGHLATDALRSPSGIALQVVFTLAVAALPVLAHRTPPGTKTRPTGQVLN